MKHTIIILTLLLLVCGCGTGNTAQKTERETEQTELIGAEEVTLYISNDTGDGFTEKKTEVEELTPEVLLAALAEERIVPIEAKVLSFMQDGDVLTLDLSKEYQEYVMSFGTSGELITIGGVVNTFLKAYDASEITILVEGAAWDTGHTEINGSLSWYGDAAE